MALLRLTLNWHALQAPDQYNIHPAKPSAARTEELASPWQDPTATPHEDSSATAGDAAPFRTIMPAPGLFGKDGEYWRSVHLVGDAQAAAQREAELREKE